MATPPSSLPSRFGCETQQTYAFNLRCKHHFHPVLTHQFEVEWPWPYLRPTKAVAAAATPHAGPTTREAPTPSNPHDPSEEPLDEGEDVARDVSMAAAATAGHLWRERRRYNRPTFILDLSSDPFLAGLDTRRAGLLLSPGYRILLPFSPVDPPEEFPNQAGRAFWKMDYRPPSGVTAAQASGTSSASSSSTSCSAAPPPHCAELLVGEIAAVEKVMRRRLQLSRQSPTRRGAGFYAKPSFLANINLGTQKARGADDGGGGGDQAGEGVPSSPSSTSATSVSAGLPLRATLSFFFYTVPFRVRWLSQLKGRIVVSLPCEERLLTLYAPHTRPIGPTPTGQRESVDGVGAGLPLPMTQVHSFALPRGVVPLEVTEIFDRPFIAVGTYDHGVLLCNLNTTSGAVESIARVISLKGYGGVLFPVTRLATLFPPLRKADKPRAQKLFAPASASASSPRRAAPAWACRSAALETLRDGALLCSSPYESFCTLVKLNGPADGVVEDFGAMRDLDTLLDVGPTVQPDIGPLMCSAARKVHWLRFVTEDEIRHKLGAAKDSDYRIAERTSPAVWCDRVASQEYPLVRLMASPPVLQSFAASYVSRHSYTKHWCFAANNRNEIVLMDRTVRQYITQSSFQLYRCPPSSFGGAGGEGQTAPVGSVITAVTTTAGRESTVASEVAARGEASSKAKMGEKTMVKKEPAAESEAVEATMTSSTEPATETGSTKHSRALDTSASEARESTPLKQVKAEAQRGAGGKDTSEKMRIPVTPACAAAESVLLEDACSGVVVTFAKDETIQVAAAHDARYVSLVTWRVGSPQPPPPPSSYYRPALKVES